VNSDIAKYLVRETISIRDAMAQADVGRCGIVLAVDDQQRLLGTVTDGDVRRAILANINLDESISFLLAHKSGTGSAKPITAQVNTDRNTLLKILSENNILHLPLLDDEHRVIGVARLDDFVKEESLPVQALIMAGGQGTRLRPLTDNLPKPLLPIGNQPLMEIAVQKLKEAGIRRLSVAVHYKSEMIKAHFGDGQKYGIEISYIDEEQPLGTAGALGIMPTPNETTLVVNGDILTQMDYRAMLIYHREHKAEMTVAVHRLDFQVPYGVVECDGTNVLGIVEKPLRTVFINAGIYLLDPLAYDYLPNGEAYDMTDLIASLLHGKRPVVAFPIREYWMDIGQHADYEKAQEDMFVGKILE
jgi:dTDP-glucose pyrophosphorylase/CBS domain-containing protein